MKLLKWAAILAGPPFFAIFFFSARPRPLEDSQPSVLLNTSQTPPPPISSTKNLGANVLITSNASALRPELLAESRRAGSLDSNPLASSNRLDELARSLDIPEIDSLKKTVLDPMADGDTRAVAVELLARSPSETTLEALTDIALTPLPTGLESPSESFERVLRARAIEGLGSHPDERGSSQLAQVLRKTQDSFLADRAHRAWAFRNHQAPSPESQDQEALKKLLE